MGVSVRACVCVFVCFCVFSYFCFLIFIDRARVCACLCVSVYSCAAISCGRGSGTASLPCYFVFVCWCRSVCGSNVTGVCAGTCSKCRGTVGIVKFREKDVLHSGVIVAVLRQAMRRTNRVHLLVE